MSVKAREVTDGCRRSEVYYVQCWELFHCWLKTTEMELSTSPEVRELKKFKQQK